MWSISFNRACAQIPQNIHIFNFSLKEKFFQVIFSTRKNNNNTLYNLIQKCRWWNIQIFIVVKLINTLLWDFLLVSLNIRNLHKLTNTHVACAYLHTSLVQRQFADIFALTKYKQRFPDVILIKYYFINKNQEYYL